MENRKVYLNHSNNLLQLEEHMYPLVDVEKPNVFRNLFHYDEIPKIAFPTVCRMKYGLRIRLSVMASNPVRHTAQSRLLRSMITFTN